MENFEENIQVFILISLSLSLYPAEPVHVSILLHCSCLYPAEPVHVSILLNLFMCLYPAALFMSLSC